jgi:anti-sigma B factor antagonist
MIKLKCFGCGLTVAYETSRDDFCPKCWAREQQAVQLIAVSDRPSTPSSPTIGRLSIYARGRDDCHTLVLNGELDVASAAVLEDMLEDLCAAKAKEIVVDMVGVEFIDSSGLRAILRGRSLCEEHGCAYRLTPARRSVQRMFEMTGVAGRLPLQRAARRKRFAEAS